MLFYHDVLQDYQCIYFKDIIFDCKIEAFLKENLKISTVRFPDSCD